jgi:hypothetical protein
MLTSFVGRFLANVDETFIEPEPRGAGLIDANQLCALRRADKFILWRHFGA